MKRVLLILSAAAGSDEAVEFAVAKARDEKAGLVALHMLEAGAASEVFDTFTDIGFIGDRPSTQLSESIRKEFRQRGYEELGRVQIKAMEEGVDFEPFVVEDPSVDKVLAMIEGLGVESAVLVAKKRRPFLKYFKRALADELAERLSCETRVFTDNKE